MSTKASNQKVKITKSVVEKVALPEQGQIFIRDTDLKGFALRVTCNGAKSFIVEKRVNGRVRRMTLARYPELTAEEARVEAFKALGNIAKGNDPVALKRQDIAFATTLEQAFKAFKKARKSLKPKTLYDYERFMQVAFSEWKSTRLIDISKDKVASRHSKLGRENGHYYANHAMRFLRAVFNFAQAQYEDARGNSIIIENPVVRLTRTKAWFREERRRTYLKAQDLPDWYKAVTKLKLTEKPEDDPNDPILHPAGTVSDYLVLMLLTGLRRQEAATLRWSEIDLDQLTLTVPNTKNHEPLTLPLSTEVRDLLEQRQQHAVNNYVFPGKGHLGYLVEPRNYIKKVIKESGISFTIHDLRRTFITVAESLDISAYAIKRLVNHKMSGDVTAGYIVSDVERLRKPMQHISDAFVQLVTPQQTNMADIVNRDKVKDNA